MRHAVLTALLLLTLVISGCGDDDPSSPAQPRTLRVPLQFATIQEAVDEARTGELVLVAAGTYADSVRIELRPGFEMFVTVNLKSGVEIRGDSGQTDDVVILGNPDQPVIFCMEVDSTTKLSNLTITGGRSGVMGWHADIVINNCVIRDVVNGAHYGAGAGLYFDFGSPTLNNCVITGNQANSGGGAVFANECRPTLTNCVFMGNTAFTTSNEPGKGGALMLGNDTVGVLPNCLFSANHADSLGGAVEIHDSTLEMVNCNFTHNSTDGLGGAFYLNYGGEVTLTNGLVENNQAVQFGGGFYFMGRTALTASYSRILGNTAPQGPDGFIRQPYEPAVVTLTCCEADTTQWSGSITLDDEGCD